MESKLFFLGYALYITVLKSTFYEKIAVSPTEIFTLKSGKNFFGTKFK
jgi:hypothetical protein